jgi:hypothetical protein
MAFFVNDDTNQDALILEYVRALNSAAVAAVRLERDGATQQHAAAAVDASYTRLDDDAMQRALAVERVVALALARAAVQEDVWVSAIGGGADSPTTSSAPASEIRKARETLLRYRSAVLPASQRGGVSAQRLDQVVRSLDAALATRQATTQLVELGFDDGVVPDLESAMLQSLNGTGLRVSTPAELRNAFRHVDDGQFTASLKRLVDSGLLTYYEDVVTTGRYSLTDRGRGVLQILGHRVSNLESSLGGPE